MGSMPTSRRAKRDAYADVKATEYVKKAGAATSTCSNMTSGDNDGLCSVQLLHPRDKVPNRAFTKAF